MYGGGGVSMLSFLVLQFELNYARSSQNHSAHSSLTLPGTKEQTKISSVKIPLWIYYTKEDILENLGNQTVAGPH